MELSLVNTLANKFQTTCPKIYAQYPTTLETEEGRYQGLLVQVERASPKQPLTAYFGGVSRRWNKGAAIQDDLPPVWNGRSKVVERLRAQACELCGAEEKIEVPHSRKLADLARKEGSERPDWMRTMAARPRQTLGVCHDCQQNPIRPIRWKSSPPLRGLESLVIRKRSRGVRRGAIGTVSAKITRWSPTLRPVRFGGGPTEKAWGTRTSPAAYPTSLALEEPGADPTMRVQRSSSVAN
jgi:AI2M/AI1M-like HNH endonuclease